MNKILENLSNDDYHANTDFISRSGLLEFRKTPAHYYHAYLDPDRPEKKQTPEMIFGSAFHTYILEPHLFHKEYAVLPDGIDRRTKAGKSEYEEFMSKSAGKTLLTVDQMETLDKMKQSLFNYPRAEELLKGGRVENSIFWECPHTKVRCKTRPDVWHDNMTVDLKTCRDASPRAFQRAMVDGGYHLQAAFNREGIYHNTEKDIKNHLFMCVEKEYPYMVAIYILDVNALDNALIMMKNSLREYAHCRDENTWPGYETQTIDLPTWAINL